MSVETFSWVTATSTYDQPAEAVRWIRGGIPKLERATSESSHPKLVARQPACLELAPLLGKCVSSKTFTPIACQDDSISTFLAAPLNLANSPSLHLLTPEEQTLCSQLRILPKPYLVIKETLVREYARRGGKLRRREARDLVKIDVNKTSRVWDFLVQAGFMKVGNTDPLAAQNQSQNDTS